MRWGSLGRTSLICLVSLYHLPVGANEAATVQQLSLCALRSCYLLIDPSQNTQCPHAKCLLSHGSGDVRVTLGFFPWLGHCALLTQSDSKGCLSPAYYTFVRCEPWSPVVSQMALGGTMQLARDEN